MSGKQIITNRQRIKHLVGLEQSTIICKNIEWLALMTFLLALAFGKWISWTMALGMILPVGGFLTLGVVIAAVQYFMNKPKKEKEVAK